MSRTEVETIPLLVRKEDRFGSGSEAEAVGARKNIFWGVDWKKKPVESRK